MSDRLVPAAPAPLQLTLAEDLARADAAELRAYARNTQRAYLADLAHFGEYAAANGVPTSDHFMPVGAEDVRRIRIPADPITLDLVRGYLSRVHDDGFRFATVQRRVAAIKWWHRHRNLPSPTDHPAIARQLKSYAGDRGDAPVRQKQGLQLDLVAALADAATGSTPLAKRDRAVLLLGFALGLRRSELAALRREDTGISADGLTTRVRRSKTDQRAVGRPVAVKRLAAPDYCPVAAVELWLNAVPNSTGPLFRSFDVRRAVKLNGIGGQDVYRILHRHLPRALRALGEQRAQQLNVVPEERAAFIERFVQQELAFAGRGASYP